MEVEEYSWEDATSPNRHGFNGMERDDDMYNKSGFSYDFGARMYNPAIGRWYKTDALEHKYPNVNPYSYTVNNPVNFKDPDGNVVIALNKEAKHSLQTYFSHRFGGVGSPLEMFFTSQVREVTTLGSDNSINSLWGFGMVNNSLAQTPITGRQVRRLTRATMAFINAERASFNANPDNANNQKDLMTRNSQEYNELLASATSMAENFNDPRHKLVVGRQVDVEIKDGKVIETPNKTQIPNNFRENNAPRDKAFEVALENLFDKKRFKVSYTNDVDPANPVNLMMHGNYSNGEGYTSEHNFYTLPPLKNSTYNSTLFPIQVPGTQVLELYLIFGVESQVQKETDAAGNDSFHYKIDETNTTNISKGLGQ